MNRSPAVTFIDPPTSDCPRLTCPRPIVDWRGGCDSNRSPAVTFVSAPTRGCYLFISTLLRYQVHQTKNYDIKKRSVPLKLANVIEPYN